MIEKYNIIDSLRDGTGHEQVRKPTYTLTKLLVRPGEQSTLAGGWSGKSLYEVIYTLEIRSTGHQRTVDMVTPVRCVNWRNKATVQYIFIQTPQFMN